MNDQREHWSRRARRRSVALLATGAALAGASWLAHERVEVSGASMLPALRPGDRLVVLRLPRRWPLRPGQLVAVRDPRTPGGGALFVKRVASVEAGAVVVRGDNDAASTDSRSFGPVPRSLVRGVVLHRYRTGAPSRF
jgi:nickel-type superoxide dismutase maturation protease